MTNKIIVIIAIFILVFSTVGHAQRNSLGLKISTLGGGLEAERSLSDSISGRIGINYLTTDYVATKDNIEYNLDLNLMSILAILDWHPFQGSFRISGGVIYNGNYVDLKAKSQNTYDIGDSTYNAQQVGNLKGKMNFNDIGPYIGLGWDTSFGKNRKFGFLFDLGVIYQGAPKVDLSADGSLASNQDFQNDLTKEKDNLQSNLDRFKYYPVIGIGFNYRF